MAEIDQTRAHTVDDLRAWGIQVERWMIWGGRNMLEATGGGGRLTKAQRRELKQMGFKYNARRRAWIK